MGKIKGGNIFTEDIADMLDVTDEVALRVHNYIDENYNLDCFFYKNMRFIEKTF